MSLDDGVRQLLFIILIVECVYRSANASPIFFSNPFGEAKMADGETENVSVYTTTERSGDQISEPTESPSVYQQIARNVIQRIATPVVSHFILANAAYNSSKVSTTTHDTVKDESKLELTEENILELNEAISNPKIFEHAGINNETEDLNERELINPKLVASNPSFNKRLPKKDDSRPERIVLYPYVRAVEEKTASEVNDLNKEQKDFFNTVSDLQDDNENEVDPDDIQTRAGGRFDTPSGGGNFDVDNGEDFNSSEDNTGKNGVENSFIYILELLGSAITLGWGAISSLFQNKMTVMGDGN